MPVQEQTVTLKTVRTHMESLLARKKITPSERIAVFDLDNTLLIGDIGEAVFARLKKDEENQFLTIHRRPIPFSWSRYRRLTEKNRKRLAYTRLVTSLAGLPLQTLMETTGRLIRCPGPPIHINGDRVPVPSPNPDMLALIGYLKKRSFRIHIISASIHFSVQMVARKLFRLPESRAFGIESRLTFAGPETDGGKQPVLTASLKRPVPYGRGKARLYRKRISKKPPLLTAGDSLSDLDLLNLTGAGGLAIWMGKDARELGEARDRFTSPGHLVRLTNRAGHSPE